MNLAIQAAIGVQQGAMTGRVEQTTLVMLAVDLDQGFTQLAQHRGGYCLIVDIGPAPAIGADLTAEDQAVFDIQILLPQKLPHRMIIRRIEGGHDGASIRALAYQSRATPPAQGQAEGIQQNGLAGTGLAGQHTQACLQIEIQTIDQHDIGNGQGA